MVTVFQSSTLSGGAAASDGWRYSDEVALVAKFANHWRTELFFGHGAAALESSVPTPSFAVAKAITDRESIADADEATGKPAVATPQSLGDKLRHVHFVLHHLFRCVSSLWCADFLPRTGGRWNLGLNESGAPLPAKMRELVHRLKAKLGFVRRPFSTASQRRGKMVHGQLQQPGDRTSILSSRSGTSAASAWIVYATMVPAALLQECCEICDYSCLIASEYFRTRSTSIANTAADIATAAAAATDDATSLSFSDSASGVDAAQRLLDQNWDAVRRASLQLATLTTILIAEYIVFVISCSMRGLLISLEQLLRGDSSETHLSPTELGSIVAILDIIHRYFQIE